MKPDPMLMIPGPTPVPQEVLEVMARPPIGHRSPEFKAILKDVYAGLQWIFQTQRPVFLYTASGTGAMEAAMVNVLNPGDEILVLSCGVFSHRWAEIANELGLVVHLQEVPAGQPSNAEDLTTFLNSDYGPRIKAVYMIHSETSTGVLNPVKALTQIIRTHSDALVIVDTVTSLGAAPFHFDDWDIDIAVSGSQKGFMIQAGLAFLAVSERAMKAHQQVKAPGYYFNFSKYEKNIEPGQTPYTPAISLIRGLQKALELMQAEGLENITRRHFRNQMMVRNAVRAMGLPLFVESDAFASPAVTSILPPDGVSVDHIRAGLKDKFGIIVANGQKELLGKIFRIGHLGAIFPRDMLTTLSSLEVVLHELGFNKTPLGTGVAAAQSDYLHPKELIHHG
jgi:aspartate aminotransferase-like enzyme